MGAFDYLNNAAIMAAIRENARHVRNTEDREDMIQECWLALYDEMPLDEDDAVRAVNRAAKRFLRAIPDEGDLPRDI